MAITDVPVLKNDSLANMQYAPVWATTVTDYS